MPNASFLKLGLTYPLPEDLIRDFAQRVDKVIVVEELDPFLEEQLRLLGIDVAHGKDLFPIVGELEPGFVAEKLTGAAAEKRPAAQGLPIRPPVLCPGCSHRGIFTILRKLKVFVAGDIGCYTLGALPPLESDAQHPVHGGSIPWPRDLERWCRRRTT